MLESSLCADDDLMGSMDELQDISQSIDDDALSSFDVPEYQSSSNGSEGSTVIGKKKKKTAFTSTNTGFVGLKLSTSQCCCF